ncbi:MAG: hypothetical protein M3Q31_07580 [Actinomycetota bacterium]|nr:hypothetical protein [Actinomycetota bacterium]
MNLPRAPALRPSRGRIGLTLAAGGLLAWVAFSDDWHAIVNDGIAITALSIASGILVAALLVSLTRRRR